MCRYRLLREVDADDVLTDWSRYCKARGMVLGGFPGEHAHTVTLVSEDHRLQVTVERPLEATPRQTLEAFLADYLRRHPSVQMTFFPAEQDLLAQTVYEGSVGFILP